MKKTKKSTKPTCTSNISAGVVKCFRELGHAGDHESGPKNGKGQRLTWAPSAGGDNIHVATYAGGKKTGGWVEDVVPDRRERFQPCDCGGEDGNAPTHDLCAPLVCEIAHHDCCCCRSGKWRNHRIGAEGCEVQGRPPLLAAADDAAIANEADLSLSDERENSASTPKTTVHAGPVAVVKTKNTHGRAVTVEIAVAEVPAPAKVARIGTHDVHPAASLFPMIGELEWSAFVDDIRTSGQRKKIVRIDAGGSWQILDGRNRLKACLEVGVQPKFRVFGDEPGDGQDPIAFVVSENVQRRHLNETQRAFVGAELVPMYEAQAKERQRAGGKEKGSGNIREASKAAESAARAVNVSASSVEKALRVNRDGAPEVIAAAKERGELKVSAAAELATLPKQKQREIVEKMGSGEMRAGKVRAHVKQEKKREVVRSINSQQVAEMPTGPFRVIVVDWPWPYDNADQHEGSRGHIPYPSMSIEQAFAMADELDKLAHEDGCVLGFWTTNAFMPDAVRIVEAWGFSWRTIRTWDKGRDGIGTWCRSRTEHLIIAERGDVEHTLNEVSTLIAEARREHSRKPEEPMAVFEKHCSGPMLEMFSREPRPNWATWGAETEKFATEAA